MTCGLLIYARREQRFRTCGCLVTHVITIHHDQLLPVCQRHRRRLERAFPELKNA